MTPESQTLILSTLRSGNAFYQLPYILYADDDLDDQAFLSEMMHRVNPAVGIGGFQNGLELFQFLEHLPSDSVLPSCIVLDLNMPMWNGMHTLKVLKDHGVYQSIPAFIFSTSSSGKDVALAEALGAVAYITKPYGQKELFEICQELAEYCNAEAKRKILPVSSDR